MIYQTLLRHRELPVMPMILRISRASIPSQTRKTLVCGCQAILSRTNKPLNSVRKPPNSSALFAELLGTSKAPKYVVHFIFLSSGAISAMQPKYGRQIFFYKAVDNLVLIDSEALPATRQSTRSTRSSSTNAITYIPKRSRTVTYQRSFFIRACRTWNVLPVELRASHISLASFKRSLFQYYNNALDLYDVDDIRTWRTICP
ncbi:unnamed protein product, partial [Porites evermanni]